VFHGASGAGGTAVIPARSTTVFHGAPGGYGPPPATGAAAAPPLPSGAAR